jgi:hypothetical protein
MSNRKSDPKVIEQVARETQEKIIRHMQADTTEEDARLEAERDARVAELLAKLEAEGGLPPRVEPEE